MKELQDLIEAWRRGKPGGAVVLATVVGTSGSTYRRAGARMLLTEEGWAAGSISGGCLEGDVVQSAWDRTVDGPALVTYDSTADQDIVWGFGLGCNGMVRVLMERVPQDGGLLAYLSECLAARRPAYVATVVSDGPELGRRWFGPDLEDSPFGCELLRRPEGTRSVELDGVDVLFEHIPPPRPLVVFGAGHDAGPLVAAAKAVGWHVTVVDRRPAYAHRNRFPHADDVVVAEPETAKSLPMDARTAVVVMTHTYLNDVEILRGVIGGPACYVGVLGPMARTQRILSDLRDGGIDPTPEQLDRLYAPIGLDIGAEGPDEIALSIVAEIQAVARGLSGHSLKGRTQPLHGSSLPGSPLHRFWAR